MNLSTMGIVTIKRGNGTYINENASPKILDSLIYGLY